MLFQDYRDGCVVREAESLDVVVDISNISNPQVFRKVCTAKSTIEAITTRDKNSTIYEWNTKRFQLERNASDSNEINKDSKETYMKTDREMCNEGETKGEDSEKPPDIEITKVETEKIPKPEQAGFIRQYWRPKSLGIYPDTCEKPSRKSSLHSVSSHSGPSRRNIRNDRLEGPEGMDDIIRNRRKISLLYIPKETRRKGKKRRDIWLRIKKDMNKNVGQGTRSAISKWLVPQRVYKVQEKQSPSRNEANRPLESEGAVETKIRVLVNPDEDLFPGGTTIQEAHEEGLKEVDRLLNLVEDDDMTIEKRGVELVKDPYEEAAHSLDDIPIVTDDIIKPVSGGRVDTHPWPARRKRDVSRFADERKHVDSSTNSCSFSPERRYAEAYEKLVDRGCAQISSGPPRLSSVRIDATPGSFKDARSPVDLLGDYREQSHCDISLYCEDDWQDGVRRKALKSRLRQAGNLENVAGGFNQSEVPLITSGLTHSIHTSSLKNDTLPGSFFRIGGCLQNISANVNLAEGTSVTEVGVSPGNGFKIRAWQDTLGSQIVDTPITKKRMQTSPVMSDSSPWGTLRTGYPPDKELRERLDASSLKTGPSPASILRRRLDKSSLNKSNRATGSSGQVVLCDNTVQINLSPYDAFSPTDRTSCMRNDSSVENIERKNLKAPSPKSVRYTGESVSCKPSRDQPGMTVDKPINTPETMTRKAASKISTESRSPNMVTEKEMGLRFRADVDKVQIMLPKLAGKDFDRVLIKVEQNEAVRKMTSDGRCVPVLSSELCCGLSDRKKSKKKCAFFKKGKSIQSYNVACSNPFGYQQPADQIVDNICSLRRLSSHSLENLVIQGCEIAEVVLMDRLDKEIVSLGVKQTQLREEEDESFFQRLCRQLKMEKWTRSSNTVTESNKPDDTPGNVDRFDTEAHRNKLFQPVRTVPSQRFEFREENGSRRNYRRRRRNHSDIDDKHVHEVTQRQRHRKKRRDRSNSNRKHEQNKSCSESEKTIKKRKPHAISGIISRVGREGKLIETFTFNPLWSPTRVSRKKPPDKRDLISKLFPSTNFIKQQSNHHGSMLEIHSTLKLRTPDGRTYHLDPESLEISDPQRVLDSSSWKRKFRSDDRVSSQTRRIDDVKSLREAVDLKSDTVNLKSQKEAVNLNIANADDSSSCASKNDYELYTVFSEKIYFTRNDFLSSENFSKHDNVHVETITVSCPSEMKDERKETVGSVAKGGKSLNFGGKEGRKNLNFGAKEGCRNLNFVGDNERNFDRSRKEVKNTNLGGRGRKRFEFR